ALTKTKPSLFAAFFKGKSNDEEDEGAGAPAGRENTAPAVQMATADPVPLPRSKPRAAATFQLASADVQVVQPAKSQQAEAKPQTPADIINARGFWDDVPA